MKAVKMKMPISRAGKPRIRSSPARNGGFTYAVILVAIVLVGIFAGAANVATSKTVQRAREEELMFRGRAYADAIKHFYAVAGRYPRTLNELLKDPRFAHRAYLRSLYSDPMAEIDEAGSKPENGGWQLVRAADGGIAGVASCSKREPIKKVDFPTGYEKFEGAKSYSEWVFEYRPTVARANTYS